MLSALHLYVKDVEAVYERALEAGATSMYEPAVQDYGDREAGLRDACGNDWYVATHIDREIRLGFTRYAQNRHTA